MEKQNAAASLVVNAVWRIGKSLQLFSLNGRERVFHVSPKAHSDGCGQLL